MATVISNDKLQRHNIDKYNFKVLGMGAGSTQNSTPPKESTFIKKQESTSDTSTTSQEVKEPSSVDSSSMSQNSKDSLIESLLKKTDEMSSNFIKLQMKLESKEEEFKLQLEKAKESAYAEGVEAGKVEASKDVEKNYQNGLNQFSTSVATLEKSAQAFADALEGIKSELISAALDISKEVIKVELSTNSNEIAKVLSSELIKELQSAAKVTLKINPKNHGALSESLGKLENVSLVSDSAVSEGGVIALSDAGNIDAQISKRFERVKKAALSE
ncbi:MAG: flagellar assembly protein FliH [Sulfurimonas sp.]|jgi:flagellar assembly protein FliH|nr:flagellar assembly protein FliH [Sulfurimonas sp.]